MLSPECVLKTSENVSVVLTRMIAVSCIFLKYQTGSIADPVLKQSHNLGKTGILLKTIFTSIVQILNWSKCKSPIILSAFLPNIKLEQLQNTVLKESRDFRKTINIFKVVFYCYCPNVFSKLLWMVCMFYGV